MKAPAFWAQDGVLPRLLQPLGSLYAAGSALRQRLTQPADPPVPVICLGNVVAGGAGKTPVALDLLRRIAGAHGLLRGYGGSEAGPLRVELGLHTFQQVGDEALLLAQVAPTWIARRRVEGATAAAMAGARVLVMDDGFQNPTLRKTFSLLVLDGTYGLGNGRVMPAGPLREPLAVAVARLRGGRGAVVIMGEDRWGLRRYIPKDIPILAAELIPDARAQALRGLPVVAFAGIGRPEKFFASLRAVGAQVVAHHAFADHYPYDPTDIQPILDEAFSLRAVPVTTAKDAMRLAADQRQQVNVVDVSVRWHDKDALLRLLAPFLTLALPSSL